MKRKDYLVSGFVSIDDRKIVRETIKAKHQKAAAIKFMQHYPKAYLIHVDGKEIELSFYLNGRPK